MIEVIIAGYYNASQVTGFLCLNISVTEITVPNSFSAARLLRKVILVKDIIN
jgi:hypothetical protein